MTKVKINHKKLPTKPYLIIKPDGARHLKEIEQTLNENDIYIDEVFGISDWGTIARALYRPQLRSRGAAFFFGFETHIWLCQYLFGNQALLLTLEVKRSKLFTLKSQTQFIFKIRNQFRRKFNASNNGTFVIMVNLNQLSNKHYLHVGRKGKLGILNSKGRFVSLNKCNFTDRWDNHFFKYIHTPGNLGELIQEWQTLIKQGVITGKNRVTKQEWKLLKFLRCLTPPSKL